MHRTHKAKLELYLKHIYLVAREVVDQVTFSYIILLDRKIKYNTLDS